MKMFDKDGKELELKDWGKLFHDLTYKIIEQTLLVNGKWVSTVWLGLCHDLMHYDTSHDPLIFETMVFPHNGEYLEEFCERYTTEEAAKEGHARACEQFS